MFMTMKHKLAFVASLTLGIGLVHAQNEQGSLESQKDKVSYAIGYNIGMNLKGQGYDVDPMVIQRGIADILAGKEPAMSETDARQALQEYQQELRQKEGEMTGDILKDLQQIVTEIGKSEKFTLIFERSQILYQDASIDITNRVIEAYNNRSKAK